jgi:hypothetical protein
MNDESAIRWQILRPPLNEFTGKYFGLLIAYVLPGFVALWGARPMSPTIANWLSTEPAFPAGLAAVVFVTLASIAAGMTVSAARWLIVDSIHARTGLRRPVWNDAILAERLHAFEALVDAHYRHYQFYANSAVALLFCFTVAALTGQYTAWTITSWLLFLIGIEALFFVTSRDTLRKYYRRAERLLHP